MFSMKMFRNVERTLKYELDEKYSHRKEEVYKAIRNGTDWIYNCDIYKEWCYEKLLELDFHRANDFSKTNIVSGGYCFYDGQYWLKLGIKNIWLYELDEDIRWINGRLTDYIKHDIEKTFKTLDCVIDKKWVNKDIGLHINFNCEKYYHMKHAVSKADYPDNCIFVFCGSNLKYAGPDTPGNGNINICETLDDFIETLPNMHIFFKDTMNDKHMVIGCLE